ncbi:MAG: response regulator [Candidatus Rokubacteria bacterium]|nr:response regulator [Candidatus Rokubacteria bacterium]
MPEEHPLSVEAVAELLLEDATADRRAGLEAIVRSGRDALALINATLPASATTVAPASITALRQSLREPQERIVSAVAALRGVAGGGADTAFLDDVSRVHRWAELLVAPVPAPRPAAAASSAETAAGREAGLILVVDDDDDNRHVIGRRLERQGYHVEFAADGARALELARTRRFDLVLLDVMMPGLDGFAVLEQLKADPATRDIPVIMVSALDDTASVVRCIERGAEDYLPKPFDPVLLRARVSASLEKKRLRNAEIEYLRHVDRVIDAASDVEAGRYQAGGLADVTARADALGRLARVFDSMASEVRAREDRLRAQVAQLRRDIEEARAFARRRAGAASTADPSALPLGHVFAGRYELLEVVGTGAMGTVYRARDRELDDEGALKALKPNLVKDPAHVDRFKTEVRLTRRISHPNVVRTHDFGEAQGVHYLTMEYVAGITVEKLIATRGWVGVPSTVAIARQVADALAVAHEHGVIHRDIKPQNLLLDDAGVLKVMDFGVARLAQGTSAITEIGTVVGTPFYMAPEQLLREQVDARSDLYAVGVVLYTCLTGQLPFSAGTVVSLIAKIVQEPLVAPISINEFVPPPLSALVVRLLAKNPAERFQTAVELRKALDEIA